MIMEENKFDYAKAMAELEEIAQRVEDASTGLEDIDKYIVRTKELVEGCRNYLRTARERIDVLKNK
jgi:exodeoxyribonuclease VII small subunit